MNDQQYPAAFVKSLLSSLNNSSWILGLTLATGVALLPVASISARGVERYGISWAGLAATVAALKAKGEREKLQATAEDMNLVERKQLMSWYNRQLGTASTVQVIAPPTAPQPARTDLVSYWKQQDKHLLIVGGTGDGKSTFIQAFAAQLEASWRFQVFDNDCTVDDWLAIRSNPNTKMYESYDAIEAQMHEDLCVIESRTQERKKVGNRWNTQPTLTIAEEMPALVTEIEDAGRWLASHAKRGRRVKRFIAAVSQNDTVDNLGLSGDAALRDSCFVRVYLGKAAVARAKKLKDSALEQLLSTTGYRFCLVDDMLFERPSRTTPQLQPTNTAGTFEFVNSAENVNELTPGIPRTEAVSDFQPTNQENGTPKTEVKTADNDTSVREFVGSCLSRLSPAGQKLMRELLPLNKVGATSEVGLTFWLRERQRQQPRLKQLLFECFGNNGSLYSSMSNLFKELASTGVFNSCEPVD